MKKYIDINEQFVLQFLRDLYMDDNCSGAHDLKGAIDYYIFVKALMIEGNFDVRKWHSNSKELLQMIHDYQINTFGCGMG